MQFIIISGPSGSGKTTISNNILKNLKYGIILNTDNYYKTGIISQILSKTVQNYFDRLISFNHRLFKQDLLFIIENGFSNYTYEYNFKRKSTKKIQKKTQNIRYVIIEGIFSLEITKFLSEFNCTFINLKIKKKYCMNRVIKRDYEERGKSKKLAKKDFLKAWELFFKNKKRNKSKNHGKRVTIEKRSEIKSLLNNLTNIVN